MHGAVDRRRSIRLSLFLFFHNIVYCVRSDPLLDLAWAEQALANRTCDLNAAKARRSVFAILSDAKSARCARFTPIHGSADGIGVERSVCIHALTQSGSTYTEFTVATLLQVACALSACDLTKYGEDPADPHTVTAHWRTRGVVIRASYGAQCGGKHRRINDVNPRWAHLGVLRDPRSRVVSHTRYRIQVQRSKAHEPPGRDGPPAKLDASFVEHLAILVQKDEDAVRKLFFDSFDRGGNASALFVRYEMLSDERVGIAILAQIYDFLGLANAPGLPPVMNPLLGASVMRLTAFATIAKVCDDGTVALASGDSPRLHFKTGGSLVGCAASRAEEVYRAHAPTTLEDVLGTSGAKRLDTAIRCCKLLNTLWGCFDAPPGTHARAPTGTGCIRSAY